MRLLSLSLSVLLVGCPSAEEEPTPAPTPEPTPALGDDDDDDGRGTPPWMVVEVRSTDGDRLLQTINTLSGYMRIGFAEVDPPFEDTSAIGLMGPVNPNIKLLDIDGDGTLDVTADIDVPSIEGGDSIATLMVTSDEVNAGREVTLVVAAFDFRGNVIARATGDRLRFEPQESEPLFTSIGPVDAGGEPPSCEDGRDNDDDGYTDNEDPDCSIGAAIEKGYGTAACNDGLDNDGDGQIDRLDPDCHEARTLSELPQCSDGIDNDGDGWIDGRDPDCGDREWGFGDTPCNNGFDDDQDGRVDALDEQCTSAGGSED